MNECCTMEGMNEESLEREEGGRVKGRYNTYMGRRSGDTGWGRGMQGAGLGRVKGAEDKE